MNPLLKYSLLVLTVLISTEPLNAATTQEVENQFYFQGELLYLQPLFDQSYYVSNIGTLSTGLIAEDRKLNEPEWKLGFRLSWQYQFDYDSCKTLEVRWSHFAGGFSDRTSGVFLRPTQVIPAFPDALDTFEGTASSEIHIRWDQIDLLLCQLLYDNPCFDLCIAAGLEYANIEFTEDIFYDKTLAPLTRFTNFYQEADFSGIGPEICIDAGYSLINVCGFGDFPLMLRARLIAAFLVSESNAKLFQNDLSTRASVDNRDKWRLTPAFDVRLGLGYEAPLCAMGANFALYLELGYEFICYRNAIQTTLFSDPIDTSYSYDLYSNLSFHGPYVALGVGF